MDLKGKWYIVNIRAYIRRVLEIPTQLKNRVVLFIHSVKMQDGCRISGNISIVNKGRISLGKGVILNGKLSRIGYCQPLTITTQKNAEIIIGEHVGMSNCSLYAVHRIEVGDDTLIGGGVKIYDNDFHALDWHVRNTKDDKSCTQSAPVLIGKHCFIGAGSIILKGVHIGDCAVIGAGSVVTKSIPPYEIWGGPCGIYPYSRPIRI